MISISGSFLKVEEDANKAIAYEVNNQSPWKPDYITSQFFQVLRPWRHAKSSFTYRSGEVAQLVERRFEKPKVSGSNPLRSTTA